MCLISLYSLLLSWRRSLVCALFFGEGLDCVRWGWMKRGSCGLMVEGVCSIWAFSVTNFPCTVADRFKHVWALARRGADRFVYPELLDLDYVFAVGTAVQKNGVLGRRWRARVKSMRIFIPFSDVLFLDSEKRSFLTGVSSFSGFYFAKTRSLNVLIQFKREIASYLWNFISCVSFTWLTYRQQKQKGKAVANTDEDWSFELSIRFYRSHQCGYSACYGTQRFCCVENHLRQLVHIEVVTLCPYHFKFYGLGMTYRSGLYPC